jgi:hypothetical protein
VNSDYLTYEFIAETLTSLGFEHDSRYRFVKSLRLETYYLFLEDSCINLWFDISGYRTDIYVPRFTLTDEELLFERLSNPKRDTRTFDELIEVIKCLK